MMNVRDRFFHTVYENVKNGADIVIVSSDLGAPGLDDFRKDYPHRFVNTGIAEQNAIAAASGLALAGKTAIAYGLNPFSVTRTFDHIRNLMASLQIPFTVAALKAGTCTAQAGFSHMAAENISLLRTLHNIRIINPSDETIAQKAAAEVYEKPQPRYIQFDPFISGRLYTESEADFKKGFAVSGADSGTVIVSYGIWAYEIKKEIEKKHLPAKLIDCFALPADTDALLDEIKGCRKIITVEDGTDSGGIGSMMLEIMNDYGVTIPLRRMSLRFRNGYPSVLTDREQIFKEENLTMDALRQEIESQRVLENQIIDTLKKETEAR